MDPQPPPEPHYLPEQQPPYQPVPSVPERSAPSSASRWRTVTVLLAAAAVALAVALVVVLATGDKDSPSPATTKTGRATAGRACEQVRLLPDAGFERDSVLADRVSAASALAQLAADQDTSLVGLSRTIQQINVAFAQDFSLSGSKGRAAIAAAKSGCRGY